MRNGWILFMVAIVVLAVSGCVSENESGSGSDVGQVDESEKVVEKTTGYQEEIMIDDTSRIMFDANRPLVVVDGAASDDMKVADIGEQSWYCAYAQDYANFAVMTKVRQISGASIEIKLPDGSVAFARNFELTSNGTQYDLTFEQGGINLLAVAEVAKGGTTYGLNSLVGVEQKVTLDKEWVDSGNGYLVLTDGDLMLVAGGIKLPCFNILA